MPSTRQEWQGRLGAEMNNLTVEQANAIYDVLVKECGACDYGHDRESFVHRQITEEIPEWRFCGDLGFGGKFWRNCGRWYVTCYREDETPKRLAMIDAANESLGKLLEGFMGSGV